MEISVNYYPLVNDQATFLCLWHALYLLITWLMILIPVWQPQPSQMHLGHTQLICCFTDTNVHWSFKKVRKNPGNKTIFFLNDNFSLKKRHFHELFCLFFFFFFLFYSFWASEMCLGNSPRNNTSIMSGLTCNN